MKKSKKKESLADYARRKLDEEAIKMIKMIEKKKKPKETCHLAREPKYDKILWKRICDEYSYIHEHLETLSFIVKVFRPNCIVEIGTGRGDSTLAFADACAVNGKGHVISIDIANQDTAKDSVLQMYDLWNKVTFIQGDSLKVPIDVGIDILFIDGLHTEEQVEKEIKKFAPNIVDGGLIIFHDTNNPAHPGVQKAVDGFMMNNLLHNWEYLARWVHCNGLTVIKRNIEE